MGNTDHTRLCSFSVFVVGGLRRTRRRLALRRSRVQWILRVLIPLRAPAFESLNLLRQWHVLPKRRSLYQRKHRSLGGYCELGVEGECRV